MNTMGKIKTFLAHYFYGLATSCWQAGIRAIKINGGLTLAASAAPKLITAPDLKVMVAIFVSAAVWEAIDYFNDNPLPALPAPADLPRAAAPGLAVAPGASMSSDSGQPPSS